LTRHTPKRSPRRIAITGAMVAWCGLALVGGGGHAAAQTGADYPVPGRTLRIIIAHGPGSGADILARLIGPRLAERWSVAVVPDNRAGGSGDLGIGLAAAADPDGYTLLCVATAFTINPAMKQNQPYDPIRSFAPVSFLATSVLSLLAGTQVPANSFAEFIALARQRPGQLNYASPGIGSPQFITMEMLKLETKIDVLHVPYRDAPSTFRDMLTGQIQVQVQPLQTASPYVHNGNVRMLAVLSPNRAPAFPDVPTMRELGYPSLAAEIWYGLFAPAATPPAVVARISADLDDILRQPDIREQLTRQGMTPVGGSPERLGAYVREDLARWRRVVKDAGLSAE
jgi:tripartite-type tricarboxylate transporter receptor subunit TctC